MAGSGRNPENIAVIIPTLNAEPFIEAQTAALGQQGLPPSTYLVVDSSSRDRTREMYRSFGAEVVQIDGATFDHGGTRKFATTLRPQAEFIVMMTQDAIPAHPESLARLLRAFDNPEVGMAYGRQLARPEAKAIERHARLMNYPARSEVRSLADRKRLGFKTCFCSDSFAAYRREALDGVGSFPENAFYGEDSIVASRMLLAGWKVAYEASAEVIHSHDYALVAEFKRYFDIGVFHGRHQWLMEAFGRPEGEGMRFVKSELRYLLKHEPFSVPSAIARTLAKYAGYRVGRHEKRLSPGMKMKLSGQSFYWRKQQAQPARPLA